MDPNIQFERLKKHLEKKGFGDIQIICINGEASGRTEINNPYVKLIQKSANKVFGDFDNFCFFCRYWPYVRIY